MSRRMAHVALIVQLLCLLMIICGANLTWAADQVGIYFDEDYQDNSLAVVEAGSLVTGYLVLNEPSTTDGVAGWELCVGIDGPATIISWELQGQTINVLSPPCFQVGVGDAPLPGSSQILLASFTLLVQDPLPITLSVQPIQFPSIAGEMAYLINSNPQELTPMYSATNEPQAAWINQYVPGAQITPPEIFFDLVNIDGFEDRDVTVFNNGGGPLVLDINIDGGDGGYLLPEISGPQTVQAGQTLTFPVRFQPQLEQPYEGSVTFGNAIAPSVLLHGAGRTPITAWEVDPELVFADTPTGYTVVQELVLTNTGEVPFPVVPSVPNECTAFSLVEPESITLAPGMDMTIQVAFHPFEDGPVLCELNLGTVVDPVQLSGIGHTAILDYSISPQQVDFLEVGLGQSVYQTIILINTGEGPLELDINLAEASPDFFITLGGGTGILPASEHMQIAVQFTPSELGMQSTELVFGNPVIENVPLTGEGVPAFTSCLVTPEYLNFGAMSSGGYYTQYFSVQNTGNVDLPVAPVAQCENASITPAQVSIAPGQTQNFDVSFYAVDEGPWECLIDLGQTDCSSVICSGTVNGGSPEGENLVGLYFDREFTQFESSSYQEGVVQAYLVLKNLSDPTGISGWQCRLEIIGDSCLLIHSEYEGQGINFANPPEYMVGIFEPTPWTPAIQLATFWLYLGDPSEEIHLNLFPYSSSSIPGEMVWTSAGTNENHIMSTHTGVPFVAAINITPLAVDAPAPGVVMSGSMVELTWQAPHESSNSYLIYRRGESGAATALFEVPIRSEDDSIVYRDYPTGFYDGEVLHYSYAMLQDGIEVSRSPETQITLNGLPKAITRLLPNAPNPFNPLTAINFEIEKPGKVRVSIYDVSGRLIKTLVSESLHAGKHSRIWQGKNQNGRQVPSGAYYLRMETDGRVNHRKMLLLK